MPCFISCGFSGNRRFSRGFGSLKMLIFGDEGRTVYGDRRPCFHEGTAHVASGFSVNGPRCSGFSWNLVAKQSAYAGPKGLRRHSDIYKHFFFQASSAGGGVAVQLGVARVPSSLCMHLGACRRRMAECCGRDHGVRFQKVSTETRIVRQSSVARPSPVGEKPTERKDPWIWRVRGEG